MSVLKKIPYINTILGQLTANEIDRLETVINSADTPTPYDLRIGYADQLPSSAPVATNKKIVSTIFTFDNGIIVKGILIYKSTSYCCVIGYDDGDRDSVIIPCYSIDVTNRTYKRIGEKLTALELRSTLDDVKESKGGKDINPVALHGILQGSDTVFADLNEDQSKVIVKLGANIEDDDNNKVLRAVVAETSSGLTKSVIWSEDKVQLKDLTLTAASNIYTSSEKFDSIIHVTVECSMSGTHAHFSLDLNPYDENISYSAAIVNWGGSYKNVLGHLKENGAVVLDLSTLTGITDVEAKYFLYA